MLLVYEFAIAVVVVARLNDEAGMALRLHIGEDKFLGVAVEEHLTVSGVPVGAPFLDNEVADVLFGKHLFLAIVFAFLHEVEVQVGIVVNVEVFIHLVHQM